MALSPIPYILPLFLGMTFDARTSSPGVSIFDESTISNAVETVVASTSNTYRVVTDMSEIRETLDISGDLALKIKTGNLDVKGIGSYIKNEQDTKNSVIILSTLRHISRSLTMPNGAKPRQNWLTDFDKSVLGTHYVQGITYGVEMVAAVKFTASNKADFEKIKGDVQLNFGSEKKTWSVDGGAKLDKVVENSKEYSSLEITFFGTLPLTTIPNTIEGLKELIKNFGDLVKEAGLEGGLPMSVTLDKLNNIAEARDVTEFNYVINDDVQIKYDQFVDRFDELSSARSKLFAWTRSLPFDLSEEYSSQIGDMLERLNEKLNTCYQMMAKIDLSKNEDQFDSILDEEFDFAEVIYLMKDIDKAVNKDVHVTSATYVHWGNTTCKGRAKRLVEGYAVGSTTEGVGGFVRYDCMPYRNVATAYKLSGQEERSLITGIRYGALGSAKSRLFKDNVRKITENSVLPCAKCHQEDASTVSLYPGAIKCPPYWELKYTGYLMSPATSESHSAQYICVDEYPTDPTAISRAVPDKDNTIDLTIVKNGKSLPAVFAENEIVRCAVCALKGGRIL